MRKGFSVVNNAEEGVQEALRMIQAGENVDCFGLRCIAMRVVQRPDGRIYVDANDTPIPCDYRYLFVVQDARRHGRGIIVHKRS